MGLSAFLRDWVPVPQREKHIPEGTSYSHPSKPDPCSQAGGLGSGMLTQPCGVGLVILVEKGIAFIASNIHCNKII